MIRRRRVFFIAGFDPRGPAFYHASYRSEAAQQSHTQQAADGASYEVSDAQAEGLHLLGWSVQARIGAQQVDTRYSYLAWDDIAQGLVPRGAGVWLAALVQFWRRHLGQGGHAASWRLARRWAWALLSLPIYLASAACVVVLAAGLAGVAGAQAGAAMGWLAGAAAGLCLAWYAWRLALRWNLVWLTHALNGSYAWALGEVPALDARLEGFSRQIAEALAPQDAQAPDDEVLLVGHCMGAMLGAVLMAQVAGHCAAHPERLARLKFLTLASPMANYALLRGDVRVADALRTLAAMDIDWLDYTAPQDPLCYFLVDALRAIGIPDAQRRVRLRLRSARYDKMVAPDTMARIRHDPLLLHFQYLLATHRPVPNDFCALTAGPIPLAQRVQEAPPA
ncbi:MAG: hypothetical protein U1F00_09080 [Rhodoferax sp.]